MQESKAPEFDPKRPLSSALAVIRTVLLSPKGFYLNFSTDGPSREPVLFVLLVGAVSGVLGFLVALFSGLVLGDAGAAEIGLAALRAALFVLLSPLGVGVAAAVYLLSIRTFVGQVGSFREVYRMAAYAFAAFVLAWIPVLGAFAVTYALMVLMGIGIRTVYRTSFTTAVVTALVGFVPLGTALIVLLSL